MTGPGKLLGLIALALLYHNAALALPQRHPGLWRQTTDAKITFNPELTPEQRSFLLKPGSLLSGGKRSVNICVTTETNAFEKMSRQKRQDLRKTPRKPPVCETETQETEFTSTTKIMCRKTGDVTSLHTVWKGDRHFTTDMHTKTSREGRSTESRTRIVGDFIGTDCGTVKAPFFPLALGVKNGRGPGEPPLFDAFNRTCIQTKANYDQISKIANAASIFRREWQASYETTTRWQVGGPYTYLTAHTGKSPLTRRSYEYCEMSSQNVDAASLEAMRQWLGPKSMPTMGWSQDFLWDQDKRTPVSMERASDLIAAGTVVWTLRVSKSQPGKDSRFTLSRPTKPGSP